MRQLLKLVLGIMLVLPLVASAQQTCTPADIKLFKRLAKQVQRYTRQILRYDDKIQDLNLKYQDIDYRENNQRRDVRDRARAGETALAARCAGNVIGKALNDALRAIFGGGNSRNSRPGCDPGTKAAQLLRIEAWENAKLDRISQQSELARDKNKIRIEQAKAKQDRIKAIRDVALATMAEIRARCGNQVDS